MKRRLITLSAVLAILFSVVSCASAPEQSTTDDSLTVSEEDLQNAKKTVEDIRSDADSIKAYVMFKDDYDTGVTELDEAEELRAQGKNASALAKYQESEKSFRTSYDNAKKKLDAARKAVEKADRDIDNAKGNALQGDDETGGAE